MRIASAAPLFALAAIAISACGQIARPRLLAARPAAEVANQQPAASTCTTSETPAQETNAYPVSALIACGPKLEKRDEATGAVTLGKHDTVVYRSARTGQMVEVKGQCEVKFLPTSLARGEH